MLAVVSADYYTRLEQGRERNPSAQVVNGIAYALRLDADARAHLFRLAGLTPTPPLGAARDQVHPALLQLLENFPAAAAYVLNPAYEILAMNRIAQALLAPFGMTNMLRMMFEHPQARVIFGDWEAVVARAVHAVRLNAGTYPDDPEIKALVADLLPQSPKFRALGRPDGARAEPGVQDLPSPRSRHGRADLPDLRCACGARSAVARRYRGTRQPERRRAGQAGVALNFLGGAPRKSRPSARRTAAGGCTGGNRATQTAQELKVLHYSTYVAPSKPAVSDDLPPGELRRMWSPTAATLVYGERDAVLVDPLMTAAEGEDLAGWIAASGKNLTTIFVTHGHGDHFFGAVPVLDRFPGAKVVATPAVAEGMKKQFGPAWLDGFWRPRFPGQLPDRLFAAEPLEGDTVMLEGQALVAVDLGHTDTDGSAALHAPSIGLVVAGDAVYGDVHLYLAESAAGGIDAWLAGLDVMETLRPAAVIAGHRPADATDDPRYIDETRRYLRAFAAAAGKAATALGLYHAVVDEYPDRLNRGVLWNSAQAVKA